MNKVIDRASEFSYLKKINNGEWEIGFNYKELQNGKASWNTEVLYTVNIDTSSIHKIILKNIDDEVDNNLEFGFIWKGIPVQLNLSNKFNFKSAYDFAVEFESDSFPLVFRLGLADSPEYYVFETLEELREFYVSAFKYQQDILADGWKRKQAIDLSVYEQKIQELNK